MVTAAVPNPHKLGASHSQANCRLGSHPLPRARGKRGACPHLHSADCSAVVAEKKGLPWASVCSQDDSQGLDWGWVGLCVRSTQGTKQKVGAPGLTAAPIWGPSPESLGLQRRPGEGPCDFNPQRGVPSTPSPGEEKTACSSSPNPPWTSVHPLPPGATVGLWVKV